MGSAACRWRGAAVGYNALVHVRYLCTGVFYIYVHLSYVTQFSFI